MPPAALESAISPVQSQSCAAAPTVKSVPDILYIMGTGRSGTTILEILLTNNPNTVGVGEVKHIFRDAFLRNLPCGCGRASRECEVWSTILQSTGWDRKDWEAFGGTVERAESHRRFPLLWAGVGVKKILPCYTLANATLFAEVGTATRSSLIVDSSKYAGRALLLARLFPEKVRVLCITRSAAGILKAFAKKNDSEQRPKAALPVAFYYLYVLLCMRLVRWRLKDRCYSIRFEELNRDPNAVLASIEAWSGHPLAVSRERVAAREWFDVGHIVTGNRLRKKGKVKFEPSAAEPTSRELSFGPRVLAAILEGYRRAMGF